MNIVQTAPIFRYLPEWEVHKQTFEDYKLHHIQPDIYGRDASLSLSNINHIHLANNDKSANKWSKIHRVHYRTNERNKPENDYWLIYAHDDLNNNYLLLTIMGPDAHNNKKWQTFLRDLLFTYVDPWVNGRLEGVI